ncbi:MAG: glycosyltransferase family 1 protein [Oscillospiraceae bacterium]|nr:glycosyltransferase family 1 protein [Oscillospiraceae bacterium]
MTRVLHVLDKINVNSGASGVVMNYYNKLDHNELTFDFMLNEDVDTETRAFIESNGSKIFVMPGLRVTNFFKYVGALRRFYRSHKYDIVHGHVANSAVFYLGLARRYVSYRIIHSHNTMYADVFWKRVRNWVLTRFIHFVANRFVACSKSAASFLYGSLDDVTIINNAIDINKYFFDDKKRLSIRHELKIDEKTVIGHVGRFSAQKNHVFLLDVFSALHKLDENTVLLLIGSGELYNDIKQKAHELGISDCVIFIGSVDNVSDYMCAMDVFVLPSLFEGLPLTGVEAQINGLPCVFSDKVTREVNLTDIAMFLPLDDFDGWVDGIWRMCKHKRLDVADINMAEFDINIWVERLTKYYQAFTDH